MPIKLLLLALCLLFNTAFSQTNIEEKVNNLNDIINPITTVNPEDNFDDIYFLKTSLKNATVIGIGESTHGTAVYNTYRQRLIRFLVQEMDYKAIIDEGDILAAEIIDAYINNQTDSLELIGNIQPVVTNKKELDWLRAYNKNKPENERVHIYGMEVRGFYSIINRIKDYHQFTPADNVVLKKFTSNVGVGYKNLAKADFENIKSIAEKLSADCNDPRCKTYLPLLNQQIDFAYRQRFGRGGFNVRDGYMFKNTKAIVANSYQNKAIVLAHNGHVQKTKFGKMRSLGYLLNNFYKDKYFVIATDFGAGGVTVFDERSKDYQSKYFDAVKDSKAVEYYFQQCKYPNFILDIADARSNPKTKFLVAERTKMLRNMGAMGTVIDWPIRLADNYDMIVFFRNTDMK
ncbi:erythromycin esterase family protein [Niabella ginsengisoli]|uniref:Erythromycin esterase family protein n=1 Tax=Niabella ginsengisoli TaxID=522298 RepID=A0ABS9SE00_9BACT|nr:erythromycin esterase family protein [Niabella ginsengisoli]MCH5596580.1 erythromycin esterase family protein [Niabella ginsengisoli]